VMKGTVGSMTSLAGAAIGGWLAFRAGRRIALLACGLLQTASLLCYVAVAFGIGGIAMFWAGRWLSTCWAAWRPLRCSR